MEKMNFCGSLCGLQEYFLEQNIPSDYPCISHDYDHQWDVLVMAWLLLYDKRKCEHNVVRLVFVYILLSTCQWVHKALAIKGPDILVKLSLSNIINHGESDVKWPISIWGSHLNVFGSSLWKEKVALI